MGKSLSVSNHGFHQSYSAKAKVTLSQSRRGSSVSRGSFKEVPGQSSSTVVGSNTGRGIRWYKKVLATPLESDWVDKKVSPFEAIQSEFEVMWL